MVEERYVVGLVVERRRLDSPWADHAWAPVLVFPTAPDTPAWTLLGSTPTAARYYAGPAELALYSTETAHYHDNLATGTPLLWIGLRPSGREPPVEIVAVTADPTEGECLTETGTNVVETVPMPPEIAGEIARFVAEYHVEREFVKRQRDRRSSAKE